LECLQIPTESDDGDQVLAHLDADADELSRLHLMPTCGTRYYTYDPSQAGQSSDAWRLVYANDLTPEQIRTGFEIVEAQAALKETEAKLAALDERLLAEGKRNK